MSFINNRVFLINKIYLLLKKRCLLLTRSIFYLQELSFIDKRCSLLTRNVLAAVGKRWLLLITSNDNNVNFSVRLVKNLSFFVSICDIDRTEVTVSGSLHHRKMKKCRLCLTLSKLIYYGWKCKFLLITKNFQHLKVNNFFKLRTKLNSWVRR